VGFDVLGLVLQAGLIVKIVLILLAGMSVVSWTIIATKWSELRNAAKDSEAFIEVYQTSPLDRAYEAARSLERSPLAVAYVDSCDEMGRVARQSGQAPSRMDAAQMRGVLRRLTWSVAREGQRLERGISFLATTGSSAPFIGLFGTVVGIIQSFQGIARAGSASLAVVAPGIAEALIATAVGLLAAIPASIFYNVFVGRIEVLRSDMALFESEFERDLGVLAPASGNPTQTAAR